MTEPQPNMPFISVKKEQYADRSILESKVITIQGKDLAECRKHYDEIKKEIFDFKEVVIK